MMGKLVRSLRRFELYLPDAEVQVGIRPFAWRLRWSPILWEADADMGWEWECHVSLGPLRLYVNLGLPWTRRRTS